MKLAAILSRAALWAGDAFVPLTRSGCWIVFAVAFGTAPFLMSWRFGLPGQAYISAVLLSMLCIGCARQGRWWQGVQAIVVAFLVHCIAVTYACSLDPARASAILPGASDYWQRQLVWIQTGVDPEYRTGQWLGAHIQLAAACVLLTVMSLGWLTFVEGFKEVDLMNFYAGRLWGLSGHSQAAIAAWHIWSILRGAGFAILTMTIIAFVFDALKTQQLRVPWRRFALASGFLIADIIVKSQTMPAVREILYGHLRPAH